MADHSCAFPDDPESCLLIGTASLADDTNEVWTFPGSDSVSSSGVKGKEQDDVASSASTVDSQSIILQDDNSSDLCSDPQDDHTPDENSVDFFWESQDVNPLKPIADVLLSAASATPFLSKCCHPRKPPKFYVTSEGDWQLLELARLNTGGSLEEDGSDDGENDETDDMFPEAMEEIRAALNKQHARTAAHCYLKTLTDNVRVVVEASQTMKRNIGMMDFFEMIGLPRPNLLVDELAEHGCHTVDNLSTMNQTLWKEKLRMYSGHREILALALKRYASDTLFWHYRLPSCPQLARRQGPSKTRQASFNPLATVTMVGRISRRINRLSIGDRILSLSQGKLAHAKVRQLQKASSVQHKVSAWFSQWLPTYYCIELRMPQVSSMETFQILATGSLLLWRVNGEESCWACIEPDPSHSCPPLRRGDILVRFDGSTAVVVNILRQHDDNQTLGEPCLLDVGRPCTVFVDGFLAHSDTAQE